MLVLRKTARQHDKKGKNCVVLGIINSGFTIDMNYVNDIFDISMIEDYLNSDGMMIFNELFP